MVIETTYQDWWLNFLTTLTLPGIRYVSNHIQNLVNKNMFSLDHLSSGVALVVSYSIRTPITSWSYYLRNGCFAVINTFHDDDSGQSFISNTFVLYCIAIISDTFLKQSLRNSLERAWSSYLLIHGHWRYLVNLSFYLMLFTSSILRLSFLRGEIISVSLKGKQPQYPIGRTSTQDTFRCHKTQNQIGIVILETIIDSITKIHWVQLKRCFTPHTDPRLDIFATVPPTSGIWHLIPQQACPVDLTNPIQCIRAYLPANFPPSPISGDPFTSLARPSSPQPSTAGSHNTSCENGQNRASLLPSLSSSILFCSSHRRIAAPTIFYQIHIHIYRMNHTTVYT